MHVQAYMQGLDADASSSGLIDKRTEAEAGLSSEQIEAVMSSLYGAGRSALVTGSHASGSAAQPTFVVNISLTFSQVFHPQTPRELACLMCPCVHTHNVQHHHLPEHKVELEQEDAVSSY